MIDIGQNVPPLRTPAFTQGALTLFDFSGYRNHWVAMSSMPNFGLLEATLLDLHSDGFGHEGALLLALCPNAPVFHAAWIRQAPYIRIPMLIDPLSRLHRLLGISRESFYGRCRSVLIDPSGVLRFRLTHDFNGRGIKSLKEALIINQRLPFPLTKGSHVLTSKGTLTPCIL
jgi:Peroxiredoxin